MLVLVLVLLYGAYRLVRAAKPLIVNTVVGLIVLRLVALVGLGAPIDLVVVFLAVFAGVTAAVLLIVLAQLGVVFEPALLVPPF